MENLVNIITICSIIGSLVWFLHQDHKRMMTRLEKLEDKMDERMRESDKRWYDLLSKFHDHDKAIDRLQQK